MSESEALKFRCPADKNRDFVFYDNFSRGITGWSYHDLNPAGAGHRWGLDDALHHHLRSDPQGATIADHSNEIQAPFSMAGHRDGFVNLRTRFNLGPHDIYAVYVRTRKDAAQIGYLSGRNPSWPRFDYYTFFMGPEFDGQEDTVVELYLNTGADSHAFGVAVSDISVSARVAPQKLAFSDNFEDGLGKWDELTGPENGPGHRFALRRNTLACADATELLSDPAGGTQQHGHAHIQSKPFSLASAQHATLDLQMRYQLHGVDYFLLSVSDGQDYLPLRAFYDQSTSLQFPDPVSFDISHFAGKPAVYIMMDVVTGLSEPAYGVAIDDVKVATD